MHQHRHAVNKVAKNADQFRVVFGLEIFPCKVIILGFRRGGKKSIAQHILLPREVLQIFMCPDSPVSGSGNFIIFQVQEFEGRYIHRHFVIAVRFHHNRENNTVKHNIVFPDKVD